MSEDLERRVERLERETGVHEERLEKELHSWAGGLSIHLEKVQTGDLGDRAVFRVNRGLNRTDFMEISERFSDFILKNPDEHDYGEWPALVVHL